MENQPQASIQEICDFFKALPTERQIIFLDHFIAIGYGTPKLLAITEELRLAAKSQAA